MGHSMKLFVDANLGWFDSPIFSRKQDTAAKALWSNLGAWSVSLAALLLFLNFMSF